MNSKRILWENIQSIMDHHYHESNLWRLCHECKIGPGTGTRIKKMETSVGLDVIEKIASRFNLQPWHLLVPNLDPSNPPIIR